ncbi:MAG: ferritin-like domain-containing protein [Candidatus Poseidoniales archaeon]|nr:MAG: ferritin-like domain-containing protein [Candidatus Poseidoniales archaeon]
MDSPSHLNTRVQVQFRSCPTGEPMSNAALIDQLNEALAWELRAMNMYAHYAANVRGIHRLQLSPMFSTEATESMDHGDVVRRAVVKLGGVPVTERHPEPIVHTTDFKEMLKHSLATEQQAASVYHEVLAMVEAIDDQDLYDAIEQIYLAELRSVDGLLMLTD